MKITILRGKKNLFCSNLTKYLTFQGSSLQDGLRCMFISFINCKKQWYINYHCFFNKSRLIKKLYSKSIPAQNNFATITICHCIKSFLEVIYVETMGNNGRKVYPTNKHLLHFVPGFPHFPTVNSFKR